MSTASLVLRISAEEYINDLAVVNNHDFTPDITNINNRTLLITYTAGKNGLYTNVNPEFQIVETVTELEKING
jgi:hypothetical protein